ncbi:PREDICTED: carbonic anhydrase 1-like [Aptenodytes forsteri]|uniref:carbonic anhydrase 1-like n=1 Tax=Aptenodytes forsteri TaxID=9233 RepID=UPI000904DE89|nr:PREDICTED: carbonic anhydrase 1-like [Aptenodytes forsteri]
MLSRLCNVRPSRFLSRNDARLAAERGPAHWKEVFPVANGDRQSPIDIKTEETKYDPSLRPLNPNYDPASAKIILNNGHSTSVEFDDTVNKSGSFQPNRSSLLSDFSCRFGYIYFSLLQSILGLLVSGKSQYRTN